MKTPNNKSLLFKKILPVMKRQTPYFSLAAVRRALGEAGIVIQGMQVKRGDLLLKGGYAKCGHRVVRVIETSETPSMRRKGMAFKLNLI